MIVVPCLVLRGGRWVGCGGLPSSELTGPYGLWDKIGGIFQLDNFCGGKEGPAASSFWRTPWAADAGTGDGVGVCTPFSRLRCTATAPRRKEACAREVALWRALVRARLPVVASKGKRMHLLCLLQPKPCSTPASLCSVGGFSKGHVKTPSEATVGHVPVRL